MVDDNHIEAVTESKTPGDVRWLLVGPAAPGMHEKLGCDLPGVPEVGEIVETIEESGPPLKWRVRTRKWVIDQSKTRGQAELLLDPVPGSKTFAVGFGTSSDDL
jgi:hypothetical protein